MENKIDYALSNKDYHSMSGSWSSTALKYMQLNSPKHFKAKYIDKSMPETAPSSAMILGSLVHALVLTPEFVTNEFVFMPDCDLRTKEGKAIKAEIELIADGRTIVSADVADEANKISESVLKNNVAASVLACSQREVSYFWTCPFSNLKMRSRVDAISEKYLIELKTGKSVSPRAFMNDAYARGYDLSMAHYVEGLRQNGITPPMGAFITVETTAPYLVQCYEVSSEFLDVGHARWLDSVTKLERGLSTDVWPGYVDETLEEMPKLYPPAWAMKQDVESDFEIKGESDEY